MLMQREQEADVGCQGWSWVGTGLCLGVLVQRAPSPCPSPLAPPHMWRNTLRNVHRGSDTLQEEQRSPRGPRAALPGGNTAEKASEPQLRSCCQPICCHRSRGPREHHYTALGMAPGQGGICHGSGICLFSNCVLPEQGSHPGRL